MDIALTYSDYLSKLSSIKKDMYVTVLDVCPHLNRYLEEGKIYKVYEVEQCKGTYPCVDNCTTGLNSITIKDKDKNGEAFRAHLCMCTIGNYQGIELI